MPGRVYRSRREVPLLHIKELHMQGFSSYVEPRNIEMLTLSDHPASLPERRMSSLS